MTPFPDTLGFFLQMMIVAMSSMILLYQVAVSGARADWVDPRDDKKSSHWDDETSGFTSGALGPE